MSVKSFMWTRASLLMVSVFTAWQVFRHPHSKAAIEEMTSMGKPRGIRNHNPTNIEYHARNEWLGQTGSDGRFAVFRAPEYGIRAAAKLLARYQQREGLGTVRDLLSRWAPAGRDNPHLENYIRHVAHRLGIHPTQHIVLSSQYPVMIAAMIEFENGVQPYDMDTIAYGVSLA